MKKSITVFYFVILAFIFAGNSFSQTQGEYTLGLGGDDYFNVIKSDGADGFYLVGSIGQSGNYDAFFVHKTSTILSAYSYGSIGTEFGTQLTNLNDGNLLITGRANSFNGTSNLDVFLTKINPATGSVIWSRSIGTDSTDLGYKTVKAHDGNILVTGPTGNNKTDMMLLKVDNTDGHVIFSRKIGAAFSNEVPFDINDLGVGKGIILLGYSGVNFLGMNEISLTLLDSMGQVNAVMFYGGTGDEDGRVISSDYIGSVYIAGSTSSYGAGSGDFYVLKLNTSLTIPSIAWFKTYGGTNNENLSDFKINNNGFLLSGLTNSFGTATEGLLIQIDTSGEVLWSKSKGSNGDDYLQGILVDAVNNKNFVIGYTNSFNGGINNDGFLVVTDGNGISGTCGDSPGIVAQLQTINDSLQFVSPVFTSNILLVTEVNTGIAAVSLSPVFTEVCPTGIAQIEKPSFSIYPNPFSDKFTISTSNTSENIIEVFDIDSRMIFHSLANSLLVEIDLSGFPAGIYTVVCNNGNAIERTKIVKY